MDVGVIGTGQMGRNHVRVYSELKPVSSVQIFDLNENRLRKLQNNMGLIALVMEDLLSKVDAVSFVYQLLIITKQHWIFCPRMNVLIENRYPHCTGRICSY